MGKRRKSKIVVPRKIEISYVPREDYEERSKEITAILAEGFYQYLKENGLLKKNPECDEKIQKLLENSQKILEPSIDDIV